MDIPEYHFEDSDKGRAEQIAYLYNLDDKMMKMAQRFFITIPSQTLRTPHHTNNAPTQHQNP